MKEHEYATMQQMEDSHWWYRGLRSMLSSLFPFSVNSANSVILDCGCGTGANLRLLTDLAPDATLLGLDISTSALGRIDRRGRVVLCQADANHLPFADKTFDLVISCDLLGQRGIQWEKVIREFYRALQPSGILLLNVPAFQWLRGEHDCATHVDRRFEAEELKTQLNTAGFQEITCRFWNGLLTLPLWLHRRSTRSTGANQARSDLIATKGISNGILSLWIRLETKVATWANLPIGSSIFVTARKPKS